jgi:competence protein ComGF
MAYNNYSNYGGSFSARNSYEVTDIRTNLLMEEMRGIRQVVKELSQSLDFLSQKVAELSSRIDDKDIESSDSESDDDDEKDKNKENKENKGLIFSFIQRLRSNGFYYTLIGTGLTALYLINSKKINSYFISSDPSLTISEERYRNINTKTKK